MLLVVTAIKMRASCISEVEWPAAPGYPTLSPYQAELDRAQQEFVQHLSTDSGWIDQGDKDGVKLSKKVNPDDKGEPTSRTRASDWLAPSWAWRVSDE